MENWSFFNILIVYCVLYLFLLLLFNKYINFKKCFW
jgi:hypothetical protein